MYRAVYTEARITHTLACENREYRTQTMDTRITVKTVRFVKTTNRKHSIRLYGESNITVHTLHTYRYQFIIAHNYAITINTVNNEST